MQRLTSFGRSPPVGSVTTEMREHVRETIAEMDGPLFLDGKRGVWRTKLTIAVVQKYFKVSGKQMPRIGSVFAFNFKLETTVRKLIKILPPPKGQGLVGWNVATRWPGKRWYKALVFGYNFATQKHALMYHEDGDSMCVEHLRLDDHEWKPINIGPSFVVRKAMKRYLSLSDAPLAEDCEDIREAVMPPPAPTVPGQAVVERTIEVFPPVASKKRAATSDPSQPRLTKKARITKEQTRQRRIRRSSTVAIVDGSNTQLAFLMGDPESGKKTVKRYLNIEGEAEPCLLICFDNTNCLCFPAADAVKRYGDRKGRLGCVIQKEETDWRPFVCAIRATRYTANAFNSNMTREVLAFALEKAEIVNNTELIGEILPLLDSTGRGGKDEFQKAILRIADKYCPKPVVEKAKE